MMTQQIETHPTDQPERQPVKTVNRRELSDADLAQVNAAGGGVRVGSDGANN